MNRCIFRLMVSVLVVFAVSSSVLAGLRDILPPPQQMGIVAEEPLQIQGSLYLVVADAPSSEEEKVIAEAARLIESSLLVSPTIVPWSNYHNEEPSLWMATPGRLPSLEAALDSVEIPAMSNAPPLEGYHLYIGSKRILLLGRDMNGLRYGMLSFSKLVATFGSLAFVDRVYIRDWPDLPRRIITFNCDLYASGEADNFYSRTYQAYEAKMNEVEWNNKSIVNGNIRWSLFRERATAARDSVRSLDLKLIMSADRTTGSIYNLCWHEGVPVIEQPLTITADTARAMTDPIIPIVNPDFEVFHNGEFDGWHFLHAPYPIISQDRNTRHSGTSSMKVQLFPGCGTDNASLSQYVVFEPYRFYRVSYWYKTSGYSGKTQFLFIRPSCQQVIFKWFVKPAATSDWTQVTFDVHSLMCDTIRLVVGTRDAQNGTLWIDDIIIEERNPIWLLRRDDTPLQIYEEPGHIPLIEQADFIIEENYEKDYGDCYIHYPTIRRVPGGRLMNGDRITMDWYCAFRYRGGDSYRETLCFSLLEPLASYQQKISLCDSLFHPDGFMIRINEISLANWDPACASRNLTPAQLVGSYVRQMYNIIQAQRPGALVQIYGDAFDPYAEAIECPRAINGSMVGCLFEIPTTMSLLGLSAKNIDSTLSYYSQYGHPSISAHGGWESLLLGLKEAEAARRYSGCQGVEFYSWVWSEYDSIPNFASMAWNLGPHIIHKPITFTDSASVAHITTEIYPDRQPSYLEIDLTSTIVHYRLLPGGTWQSESLSPQGADLYAVDINLTAPGTSGLEYYIEASDSRERVHSAPADAPFNTFIANFPDYGSGDTRSELEAPVATIAFTNGRPVVRWTPVKGAKSYEVHISSDAAFSPSPATLRTTISAPFTVYVETLPLSMLPERLFYRVVAVNTQTPKESNRN